MDIELKQVTVDEKKILKNLLEKHNYEFSQWDKRDVNNLGFYGYQYLDYYWTENNRWAYFIFVKGKLAGFAMVIDLPEVDDRDTDFQIAKFSVMYKYRRMGVGKQAFLKVLDNPKGKWQLKRHPANLASVHFWNIVISEYTNGQYELVKAYPRTEYDDRTLADVFFLTVEIIHLNFSA
ncbi:MAG: GNAT family N-acetyltransferase [Ethanoligenens sp.]